MADHRENFWAIADGAWHWWPEANAIHEVKAPAPAGRRRRPPNGNGHHPICGSCEAAYDVAKGLPLTGGEVFTAGPGATYYHLDHECTGITNPPASLTPVPAEYAFARGLIACPTCKPEEVSVHA